MGRDDLKEETCQHEYHSFNGPYIGKRRLEELRAKLASTTLCTALRGRTDPNLPMDRCCPCRWCSLPEDPAPETDGGGQLFPGWGFITRTPS